MNGFNLPNLPTDTLYKFLTVFGLVILLTSFLTPVLTFKDNDLTKYSLTLKTKNLERKSNVLDNRLKELDSLTKSIDMSKRNVIYKYQDKRGIWHDDSSSHLEIVNMFSELNLTASQSNGLQDSLLITKQQLNHIYSFEEQVIGYCNKGIFYGIIITVAGFFLWFLNNQVYQDLFIKIQGGYKIVPKTNFKKGAPQLTEEQQYINAWRQEIVTKILTTIILFLSLYIIIQFFFDNYFPSGIFEIKRFEIVTMPKQ